jgi:hypothetical protein
LLFYHEHTCRALVATFLPSYKYMVAWFISKNFSFFYGIKVGICVDKELVNLVVVEALGPCLKNKCRRRLKGTIKC